MQLDSNLHEDEFVLFYNGIFVLFVLGDFGDYGYTLQNKRRP